MRDRVALKNGRIHKNNIPVWNLSGRNQEQRQSWPLCKDSGWCFFTFICSEHRGAYGCFLTVSWDARKRHFLQEIVWFKGPPKYWPGERTGNNKVLRKKKDIPQLKRTGTKFDVKPQIAHNITITNNSWHQIQTFSEGRSPMWFRRRIFRERFPVKMGGYRYQRKLQSWWTIDHYPGL